MGLLSKIISVPSIGKMALEILKKRAFKPFQIPLEKVLEKQNEMLAVKFKRMEGTEIGRRLGVHKQAKLQDLPVTEYSFYEPFYSNPSPSAFMYPLEHYKKVKTSGTAGKEKWYMLPRQSMLNAFRETCLPLIMAVFHNGERITLEYADNLYINVGPAPFIGGSVVSLGTREKKIPFINIVPNVNLPYKDKVQYFISNYERIDGAVLLTSTLVSQIIPAIGKPIKLKGLLLTDTPAEIYLDEIEKYTGAIPKTVYGSTETTASTVSSVQHRLGFFFDWRRGIFEFIPLREGEAEERKPISINEVKVGKVYQLVYTSFETELTRIDLKDSLECIALGDDILGTNYPIFKFHGRLEKTISLQNFTRISEAELLAAFKEAGVSFFDFTTRVETEKGLEYLTVYMEHTGNMNAKEIESAVHKQLYRKDKDYKDLCDCFEYIPIKVHLIPRGTFARYLEEKGGTFPKVDRINVRDEEFKKLIRLAKIFQ